MTSLIPYVLVIVVTLPNGEVTQAGINYQSQHTCEVALEHQYKFIADESKKKFNIKVEKLIGCVTKKWFHENYKVKRTLK